MCALVAIDLSKIASYWGIIFKELRKISPYCNLVVYGLVNGLKDIIVISISKHHS